MNCRVGRNKKITLVKQSELPDRLAELIRWNKPEAKILLTQFIFVEARALHLKHPEHDSVEIVETAH